MTTTVNVHQAKTHFSKLLERVRRGEEIIVAKAGKPVAKLVPLGGDGARRTPGSARGNRGLRRAAPRGPPGRLRALRVLLDSRAFLWWIGDDPRLSPGAREVIAEGDNEIFFSAASAWELAIKSSLGRLRVPADFERFVTDQVDLNGFSVLPVQLSHALRVHGLPLHHKDPFERMLVAQALVEDMPLVSRDRRLAGYGVRLLW